jgi:hypothetical protein
MTTPAPHPRGWSTYIPSAERTAEVQAARAQYEALHADKDGLTITGHPDSANLIREQPNTSRVHQVCVTNNNDGTRTLLQVGLSFISEQQQDHIILEKPDLPLEIAPGNHSMIQLTYNTPELDERVNAELLFTFTGEVKIAKALSFCTETELVRTLRESVQPYTRTRTRFRYSEFAPDSEGDRPLGRKTTLDVSDSCVMLFSNLRYMRSQKYSSSSFW